MTRPLGFYLALVVITLLTLSCSSVQPSDTSLLAAVGTPVGIWRPAADPAVSRPTPTNIPDAVIAAADAEYLLLSNLYERVAPTVVNIDAITGSTENARRSSSSGSGFVFDDAGHILTNAHVIQDASAITVTFNDGYVAAASLVGMDVFTDLAVLRVAVDPARLLPAQFGSSDAVRVGERAVAIGNPFGLASSMTVGIISGLGRQLPSAELMGSEFASFRNPLIIQIDAAINPGSSGGPLLNSRGEVIGVTTAIRSESGAFEGIGFAVPASTVRRVVPELIAHGRIEYPWLGIGSIAAQEGFGLTGLAEPLDLPVTSGVLIAGVTPGSPAARAGLRGGTREVIVRGRRVCAGGDIIVAINGLAVHSMDDLLAYLMLNVKPGDQVTLQVARGDHVFDLPLVVTARPDNNIAMPDCGRE